MRTRLRPAYSAGELLTIYVDAATRPLWPGHKLRIERTIEIARDMWRGGVVADLSCSDGAIPLGIPVPAGKLLLGDLVGRWDFRGPIERTIDEIPPIELFICSETLEHIDDPDALLVKIRGKCEQLLLSTPCDEMVDNPEHYWRWGTSDIAGMLDEAGFHTRSVELLTVDGFTFQIWRAS